MEQEVLKALLEMIKTGGQMTVWGIVAYWGMQLLTVAVKGGVLWGCLKILISAVTHCWDNYQLNKDRRVTLISKEASDCLISSVKLHTEEVNNFLEDIKSQLQDLYTKWNDSQKTSSKSS